MNARQQRAMHRQTTARQLIATKRKNGLLVNARTVGMVGDLSSGTVPLPGNKLLQNMPLILWILLTFMNVLFSHVLIYTLQ